ncbi:MAG: 16S rRNA (cytosine(967)-C(5))-methyltransferase RsmB [Tissierellia bacterium]|nr:16S rRNA (cytosine(967)-C(5))-methyltransferase RsmB [Tissierellia bacterium]
MRQKRGRAKTKQQPVIKLRRIVHEILMQVETEQGYSDELIGAQMEHIADDRDYRLLRRIVLGVLERKAYLDHLIGLFSSTKLDKLDPNILQILRVAIYQLIFMSSVPDHAAINEAVELSKAYAFRGVHRYVNGVLRSVSSAQEEIRERDLSSLPLEIQMNMNPEIVDYLLDSYPEDFAMELMNSFYDPITLAIRVNTKRISLEGARTQLEGAGYSVLPSKIAENCLRIASPYRITEHPLFTDGSFTVQGEGSSLAVQILDPQPGERVLDLCAAPGTKSLQIAEVIGPEGRLVANDVDAKKLVKIRENFSRIAFASYDLFAYDASEPIPGMEGSFDRVLVDAPCSALGLIARKPEIRYRRRAQDIQELAVLQRRILKNAVSYLLPGGVLVYSTCTYGPKENGEQVDFIQRELGLVQEYHGVVSRGEGREIQLFNHFDKTDGFFISRFRRIE